MAGRKFALIQLYQREPETGRARERPAAKLPKCRLIYANRTTEGRGEKSLIKGTCLRILPLARFLFVFAVKKRPLSFLSLSLSLIFSASSRVVLASGHHHLSPSLHKSSPLSPPHNSCLVLGLPPSFLVHLYNATYYGQLAAVDLSDGE